MSEFSKAVIFSEFKIDFQAKIFAMGHYQEVVEQV